MILRKAVIPKNQLASVPSDERTFFVQVGLVLTELMILHKMLLFSSNQKTENEVLRRADAVQTFFFQRTLTGKLAECWELLEKNYFGKKLSQTYDPLLNTEARESLDSIKKYFGKANLVQAIRNKYAFHYSQASDQIDRQIQAIPDSEDLELYLAREGVNCLFSFSDMLVTFALLQAIDPLDSRTALKTWLSEVSQAAEWFISSFDGIMLAVAEKYWGEQLNWTEVEIPDPPNISDVRLPYFIGRSPA